jgi:hypothetical protein
VFTFGSGVRFVAPRAWTRYAGYYSDSSVRFQANEQIEAGRSIVGSEWHLATGCPRDPDPYNRWCCATWEICAVVPAARRFSGGACDSVRAPGSRIRHISPDKAIVESATGGGNMVIKAVWIAPSKRRAATLTCDRVVASRCRAILLDWLATKRP